MTRVEKKTENERKAAEAKNLVEKAKARARIYFWKLFVSSPPPFLPLKEEEDTEDRQN